MICINSIITSLGILILNLYNRNEKPYYMTSDRNKTQRVKKIILISGILIILFTTFSFLAFRLSPWPSALIIRYSFNKTAVNTNSELLKHVPQGVSEMLNIQYDIKDADSKLDIYYPSEVNETDRLLPVIVWIHGGALISGSKDQLANYCKILASKGFVVVAIDYSTAPESKYPKPLIQTNAALAYLKANAVRLHIDSGSFILAGDSGGAHIAAQMGNITVDSSYSKLLGIIPSLNSKELSGLILYCGPYDIDNVNLKSGFGDFLKTVLWSYSGKKDFSGDPYFKTASIINYVNADFPPCFISAGNGDPLLVQSQAFAEKLSGLNVKTDTLFFQSDFKPALPHEYQFDLDTEAGQLALERSIEFLKKITSKNQFDKSLKN